MKAQLPHPEHYSYQLHRKQRTTQIILPVVLSAVVFVGMIVLVSLATFKSNGDVARWAEISTIWIIIPIIVDRTDPSCHSHRSHLLDGACIGRFAVLYKHRAGLCLYCTQVILFAAQTWL